MPNINRSTIVSVFNEVDSSRNFSPIAPIPSMCNRCVVGGRIFVGIRVVVGFVAFQVCALSFVLALFALNETLSSMSINSLALLLIHFCDACCSISRFFSLCSEKRVEITSTITNHLTKERVKKYNNNNNNNKKKNRKQNDC